MTHLNFQWKAKTGQFQSGENLYLSRIQVGQYSYNAMRGRSESHEGNDWIGNINLPSLKTDRVCAGDIDGIKMKLQNIVTKWFNEALK